MIKLNKIYNENCLDTMSRMSDNFIDLIVTSPPYDNLRDYQGYTFNFEPIAKEIFRVIKIGGVVVWVIGDQTINGSETGTSFKHALYFKMVGFNLHDTMIYLKNNPIPLTHNRYEQSFEYMFVLSKEKPKTFNPIKVKTKTSGNYKHRCNTGKVEEGATRNRNEKTLTRETKYKINTWDYDIGSGKGETKTHPAPFPEKLANDHIVSWSNENDLVYDPFMGSGTTAKMAILNKRNYIGSEMSKEYIKIINEKIQPVLDQGRMF